MTIHNGLPCDPPGWDGRFSFFSQVNHRIGPVQLQWEAFFAVCHDLKNRKARRLTCPEGFSIF